MATIQKQIFWNYPWEEGTAAYFGSLEIRNGRMMRNKLTTMIENMLGLTSIPIDEAQFERYARYQNISRIRHCCIALFFLSLIRILKLRMNTVPYAQAMMLASGMCMVVVFLIYFFVSASYIKSIAEKPKLSNALCIFFWVSFILVNTPYLVRDIQLRGDLFNYLFFCGGGTIIPIMKRRYMPIAFGLFAVYNIGLCIYAGATAVQYIDIALYAMVCCFLDVTVIFQYVSAISVLNGSKYELQNRLESAKKDMELGRIKMSISQMQPHFLYNALSSIQTIVKVNPDYAFDLIGDFTVHLRSTIKALSTDAPIPFLDEISNVTAYLNIEKMRFGDALDIKFDLKDTSFNVIPLSIQPIAENAARHGIRPKGKAGGTIVIRSYATAKYHVVEVEDNGVGFDSSVHTGDEKEHGSIGIDNLSYRLKELMDASVVIKSQINVGTKVTICFPKR